MDVNCSHSEGGARAEGGGAIATLAELDAWLLSCASMAPNRRYQRRAAIRSAVAWFNLPADKIGVEPSELRKRFAQLSPGALGVTRKRISNVKSALLSAIRAAGILPKLRHVDTFLPSWKVAWDQLTDPEKRQLSRLFRFCSAKGITPQQFDDKVSGVFLEHLLHETLVRSPRVVHQNACRRWNGLCNRLPDLPGRAVTVPRYMKTLCLPDTEFLPELWAEFEAFLRKLATADYFDVRAPATPLRPETIRSYRFRFHMYVSALRLAGCSREEIVSLAFCVQRKQVEAGLRTLLDWRKKPGYEARHSAASCAILLLTIANRWIPSETNTDLAYLKSIAGKLRVRHKGMSPRNRKKVSALKHEANLARLFIMPMKIAKTVGALDDITWSDALLFQKALALIILMFCPLRISTLVGLRLDQHLVFANRDMTGGLMLEIPEEEFKNNHPASMPLPKQCADLIRLYVERFRPLIAPEGSPFLFTGEHHDRGKDTNTMGKQIKRLVHEKLGFDISPHIYRHLVHIVVLNRFPGAYAMVARVLTHRNINTTIQNYSYMDVELSMRTYQELVQDKVRPDKAQKRASGASVAFGIDRERL